MHFLFDKLGLKLVKAHFTYNKIEGVTQMEIEVDFILFWKIMTNILKCKAH